MSVHPLDALFTTIKDRQGADPASSYTAKLYAKGRNKIVEKIGEEAVELVIAGCAENDKIIPESVDVLYHMMVLWADAGIDANDIWAEVARRAGVSGLDEKASRPKDTV